MTEALSVSLEATVDAVAFSLARKHRLEADGVIWCWNCSKAPALMPSLHCPHCLASAWRTNLGGIGGCPNRAQTPEDAEACRILKKDSPGA